MCFDLRTHEKVQIVPIGINYVHEVIFCNVLVEVE